MFWYIPDSFILIPGNELNRWHGYRERKWVTFKENRFAGNVTPTAVLQVDKKKKKKKHETDVPFAGDA